LTKNILFILLLSIFFQKLIASEKENILNELSQTNSINFSFIQKTNNLVEEGKCILLFPKKLKCKYFDDKLKELIINENKMVVLQKRYNKSYFYPVSKSPFVNILEKEKLIEMVKNGEIQTNDNEIRLIHKNHLDYEVIVMFSKDDFKLMGWTINDQYNNKIIFLIKIESVNEKIKKNYFVVPYVN